MSSNRLVLNKKQVRWMLRSDEMKAICKEYADDAVSRLGSGYKSSTYTGKNRVNASVIAVSASAKRDNLKNNTILKAVK